MRAADRTVKDGPEAERESSSDGKHKGRVKARGTEITPIGRSGHARIRQTQIFSPFRSAADSVLFAQFRQHKEERPPTTMSRRSVDHLGVKLPSEGSSVTLLPWSSWSTSHQHGQL